MRCIVSLNAIRFPQAGGHATPHGFPSGYRSMRRSSIKTPVFGGLATVKRRRRAPFNETFTWFRNDRPTRTLWSPLIDRDEQDVGRLGGDRLSANENQGE